MPNLHPQYAFVAGEISPEFLGRTDLVKYSLGAALVQNFTVGIRGGLYSRAGSEFVGPSAGTLLVRFRATANDYVLEFGDLTLRIIRNGGYLLESAVAITAVTLDNPGKMTAPGHGFTSGDLVYVSDIVGMTELNGRYFTVGTTTTNTFLLLDGASGATVDTLAYTLYASGGTVSRVYTVATTYAESDLSTLRWNQEYNDLILTHLSYPPKKLTFIADTNWTLADITFSGSVTSPGAPTLTPSAVGAAGMAFSITAVVDDVESIGSPYTLEELSVNYTATAGSMLVTWPAVSGASYYNVYRSVVLSKGADVSRGEEVGYIGRALSTQFTDTNITSDFLKTPPVAANPFADSPITKVDVTAGGTAYAKADTVSISGGGGSGFVGYPVVDASGTILSVVIVNGGSGYSSPVVSFGTSTGSGATASATAGPASGNNPRTMRKFQQRDVYAGTLNYPMTLWGSRPGAPTNFDVSSIVNAGDAYSFRLDASVVKPILHLHTIKSGLLVFTSESVSQLKAPQGEAVSAINALAEPQAYNGIGDALPISIGLDVIFPEGLGYSLAVMEYTIYTNSFNLRNLSSLSPHLLGPGRKVTRMEFLEEPDKLLYCLREDGTLLTLTYDRVEQVYGWAQHTTKGLYKDCCAVNENGEWVLYLLVSRLVGGAWVKFVERVRPRDHDLIEDFWCVDAGLASAQEMPAATLTPAAATGTGVTFTASAGVFASGDVGKVIRIGGGRARVVSYTSATVVVADILDPITLVLEESGTVIPLPVASGDWTMAAEVTSVTNLWHLEGETVSALADGNAYMNLVVTNGTVTWAGAAASKIIVGLPYVCKATTLPVATSQEILESRRKDIIGLGLQVYKTRGLSVGADFASQVELKEEILPTWGAPVDDRSGALYVPVNTGWSEAGSISFRQSYPLPAAVLSIIYSVDAGDT